jgi:hypothetical protein
MSAITLDALGATRSPVRALVAAEARRTVRSPWPWFTIAIASYFAHGGTDPSYASGGYRQVMASFSLVAAGLFGVGVQAGGRDRTAEGGPLSPEAPLGGDTRALARLLGTWPALLLAGAQAVVVVVIQRRSGGMWIADFPRGSDAAFSALEVMQIPVLYALAIAGGVAAGRATSRGSIVSVLGALAFTAAGVTYWAWQWVPMIWFTPLQSQPVEIPLGTSFVPSDAPTGWLLSAPDAYQRQWGRVVVDAALAGWHLVYLAGVTVALLDLALRGRRARAGLLVGALIAALGIVGQAVGGPAVMAGA